MPTTRKRRILGRGPNGVSSPCGLVSVTTLFSIMPVSLRQTGAQDDARESRRCPSSESSEPCFRCLQHVGGLQLRADVDALQDAARATAAGPERNTTL